MADDNAVELLKRGDKRFAKRQQLDSLRHEIALNFAPELAEWTTSLQLGADFAAHLTDGTPILLAREYAGLIGAMLRPGGKQWAWHRTADDELNSDPTVRAYLDWRSQQMMRIVFDRRTGAEGALTAADQFYGLFGDAVISCDYNGNDRTRLIVQNHHTKDCVWTIGQTNSPDTLTRKEFNAARVIKARFSQPIDRLHEKITEACEKDGDQEFELRHEMIPAAEYDAYVRKTKLRAKDGWYSVWVDATNKTIIRETHSENFKYVIPRAGARHGIPYGFSRATMYALPDARMIQQQAMAIIEAAEKQLSPPLVAYADTIRGDIRLDGITWVDRAYDERQGDPVRALELGKNFNLGVDSIMRTEAMLVKAFYLDRLRMPDNRTTKTREQAMFEIDEFVRSAVPMFSPMKVEYNDAFLYECDRLIDMAGGYADMEMPKELEDIKLQFQWDNPLTDMIERQKAMRIGEVATIAQTVAGIEAARGQSESLQRINTIKMTTDGLISLGAAAWIVDEREARKAAAATAEQNMMREAVASAPNIAQVIKSGTEAAQIASDIPNPAEPSLALPAPM